ncbi:serine/threonine-protein kinase/endoribonuclease IRE1-like [Bolinopsis microptera]|uniref:serine/threonine-protein kinase/endoribonuclease IRE1-like n=1 Tax=Bolinopsis microptera TaxID=2820187 RepID=UPI0030794278
MICQDPAKIVNADREVRALQALQHPNVITYHMYCTEGSFVYIALDLCRGTLIDCIDDDKKKDIDGQPLLPNSDNLLVRLTSNQTDTVIVEQDRDWMFKKHLLQGIAAGLSYLHGGNSSNFIIIHGDLTPQNVLIKSDESNHYGLKAIISDFGFCRELTHGETSISASQAAVGTNGWMAREQLMLNERISTATDIFAFGCIAHYVLSPNRAKSIIHPFGTSEKRNKMIEKDKRICYLYENAPRSFIFKGDLILADIMIGLCVKTKRTVRPHADEILSSPFFWGYDKKMLLLEQIFNEYKDNIQQVEKL